MRLHRSVASTVVVAAVVVAGLAISPTASAATASPPTAASYTLTNSTPTPYNTLSADSPASPFVDKDGTFYTQESTSLYGANDTHAWGFATGTSMEDVQQDGALSAAVNPANPSDANNNTTYRCVNSPTGISATTGSGYPLTNYCDLIGTWVDPDTGNWIGLVHDEFTGNPFGDGMHYDSVDRAISTDQGKTWAITGHVLTSPFSTTRNDTTAFPNDTYYYGDGDQRLFVDVASGYFYVYYGQDVIDKTGGGILKEEHVARAPISDKMATGWEKWYEGSWSQPGVGGKESNLVPVVSSTDTGYSPASQEYNPFQAGTIAAQQSGTNPTLPTTDSPLLYMSVTYDAYLGLYLAEAEPPGLTQTVKKSMPLFATDNLATEKWFKIADTGSLKYAFYWYHWFIDSGSQTSGTIVGKSFDEYCQFYCTNSSGDYTQYTLASDHPASIIDTSREYKISSGAGAVLSASLTASSAVASVPSGSLMPQAAWKFRDLGDGSYAIDNVSNNLALGVTSVAATTSNSVSLEKDRAWGTQPLLATDTSDASTPNVGQQWFVIPSRDDSGQVISGSFRLINRYSGLALALPASSAPETTPVRSWTDASGSAVGGNRTAAQQTLSLVSTDFPVVTASSQNTATGQLAYNVVDGVVGGYLPDPSGSNPTAEWASTGEKAGAWLKLQWSSAHILETVVLHDRPNPFDQVTSGTLTLSNGTVIPFGSLPNDGTGLTVTLPSGSSTTSLTITVSTVGPQTSNIGLSEVQWTIASGN